jgi:glycosyltransferase involved in cell wall biosynthesis
LSAVLFLATDLQDHKGGIASVNLAILRSIKGRRRAHKSIVVLSLHDRPDEIEALSETNVHVVACSGNRWKFSLLTLRYAIGAEKIFAGHVRLAVPLLLLPSLDHLVVFGHGSEVTGSEATNSEVTHRIRNSSRWVIERAGLLLTNSKRTARRIRLVASRAKPVACPLGLTEASRDKSMSDALPKLSTVSGLQSPLGSFVILLVGRMDPAERKKGHRELLAAFPIVRRSFPDAQVVFAGPGADQSALKAQALEHEIGHNVFIEGPLSRSDLEALYQHCFAYVMPSQQEGFGIVYLEAMNARKACLGCRNDGAEEIIEHGETGILLDRQDDIEALAAAIISLLADVEKTRKMGERGYARLQQQFTGQQFDTRFCAALDGMA